MTSISGRWVPYGAGALQALREELSRAKGSEPLAPVTVVVASNQAGVSVRRRLASGSAGPVCGAGPGLIGVSFLTAYRLAELLGAASLAGQGRRPVSTPVLAAAVRAALTTAPGIFGPVTDHTATEMALVSSYRELRDLTPAAIEGLSVSGPRAAEVVRICQAARERLAGEWYDEEDLMAAATGVAASGAGLGDVGTVVVYLPQRLSRHAAELLRTVGGATHLSLLAGSTGVERADAEVTASVGRLGVDLGPAPTESILPGAVSVDTTRIITASDADDEVRAAVRTVVDAVRAGISLDRIAVLHAAPQPYARLLHDHLHAAGVTTNGAADLPLAGRLASRTLLGLLALPSTGYRRQDVFAWITGAPVLLDGRGAPSTSWERISREAGVVAGRDHWDSRLTHLASGLEHEADAIEADQEEPQWRAERARADAERARSLRRFVVDLVDRLAAAAAPQTWGDRVRWTKRLLDDVLGGPSHRDRWPEDERRAAERLDLALDRLAVLDRIEGPIGFDVFARTLAVELEADLQRVGRFGEGVLLGPVSMGVGVDVELLILVGLAEGTFPATVRDDSLLPDEDRERSGGELPLRSGHVDRLHHQFLATLGGARAQVLCVPKGDLRRSRERVPSRWVLQVASALAEETWWTEELLTGDREWLTHVASFDAGLRTAAVPATAQEHRLRHLLSLAPERAHLHAAAATVDRLTADGVAALDARRSPRVTRFDGNLAGQPIPSPLEGGTSATRLESWAKCPHGYLMEQILRIEPLEQPEDSLQISPLDRGDLVHQALERFILEVLEARRCPEPTEPWTPADHQRLAAIATDVCAAMEEEGLTGRRLFWQRDRRKILADLDRFLREDDAHRSSTGARPIAAELAFGIDGTDPVQFPLGDGRSVPIRGKADRVDRTTDGALHVLDYKTGRATQYKDLSDEDPHQGGRRLQLAVYGLAARQHAGTPDAPVQADYWFISSKGQFEQRGYPVTHEVTASVGQAMRTIVDGIEAGIFPPRPKPPDTSPFTDCHYCDPDGLGTNELVRQWERKLHDPAIADYLALVAPSEDELGEETA